MLVYESSHTSYVRVSKMWGVSTEIFFLYFISIYVVLCENTVSAKMDFHTLSFSTTFEFVRIYVGKMPCTFAEYQLFNQLLGYWFLIVGFFMCISKEKWQKIEIDGIEIVLYIVILHRWSGEVICEGIYG